MSLLVAAAENDVIGDEGRIPWRLPADLRRFAATTSGHAVVMGRVTFESIIAALGRPLPGRHSVVISRAAPLGAPGGRPPEPAPSRGAPGGRPPWPAPPRGAGGPHDAVTWVASPSAAAKAAESLCERLGQRQWFVIGGASVYRQMLTHVDAVHLTRVHAHVAGDTAMPSGWLDGFSLVKTERVIDAAADLSYSFIHLDRAGSPGRSP